MRRTERRADVLSSQLVLEVMECSKDACGLSPAASQKIKVWWHRSHAPHPDEVLKPHCNDTHMTCPVHEGQVWS